MVGIGRSKTVSCRLSIVLNTNCTRHMRTSGNDSANMRLGLDRPMPRDGFGSCGIAELTDEPPVGSLRTRSSVLRGPLW